MNETYKSLVKRIWCMIHNFLRRIYASFILVMRFIKISYGIDMKEIWLFLSAALVIQIRFIFNKFDLFFSSLVMLLSHILTF